MSNSPLVYQGILITFNQLKQVISEQVEREFEASCSKYILKEQEQKAAVQQVTKELLLDTLDRQANGQAVTEKDLEQFVVKKVRTMLTHGQSSQPKADAEQQETTESITAAAPDTTGEQIQDATAPAPQAQEPAPSIDSVQVAANTITADQVTATAPVTTGEQVQAPIQETVPAAAPAPARPTPSLAATEPQVMPVFSDYINQIKALKPLPFAELYSLPIKPEERFSIGTNEKDLPDLHLARKIPATGSTIVAKHSSTVFRVILGNALTQTKNSSIYQTDMTGIVAKIYHSEKLLKENAEKVKLLISKTQPCSSICFPLAILYNHKDELIGHLLPQAQGFNLASTVYIPANLKKHFISWTKADTVQLCISILERFDYLYKRNIFVVGLPPKDILFKSPTEVYFIGTEKYQIDGYPSSLYCWEDTEAKGSKWTPHSVFLSPQGSVRYSLAILLFQIMMLGKHPYTNTAREFVDNIKNATFAYLPNSAQQGFVPEGPWLAMWSHLDSNIQQAFYDTFHVNGKYHHDHMHLSCEAWLDMFKAYHNNLVNSQFVQQNPMALDLVPAIVKA